ncbi:MAG TPA: pyridoxamine 5'-phosphate oxidase family protein [Thermoanaerobacterales bacterium]|nr:pyridoxamine 5'-phosphate oxidase family protein [Thermoanaerobacterales bacterium]
MFVEIRRKDKELNINESKEILAKGDYGVLSTINEENYPYGVPLNYAYYDDYIYFHSAIEGHKLMNIYNNSKISFCVVSYAKIIPEEFDTRYKSVIIFGNVKEVFDDEKEKGFYALLEKYSKDFIEEGKKYIEKMGNEARVFKIHIEHITGKTQ